MVAYTHYRSDPRCRREAEALAERGDEVHFICLGTASEPKTEMIAGVKVRHIVMRRYRGDSPWSYLWSYAAFFVSASQLRLRRSFWGRFDIIHVHSMPDQMVFVALVPRLLGAKVVLDLHELSPELYAHKFGKTFANPLLKIILFAEWISVRYAHRLIVTTTPQAEILAARCKLRERPFTVMNTPDPQIFGDKNIHTPKRVDGHVFKIVHHGTLVHRFGTDIVIKALDKIAVEIPEARLSIYGSGDFVSELREEISRLSLEARVEMSGESLPLEDVAMAISDAQLGVVPNRDGPIMRWALPTKMMEYIALGIPVIVARTEIVSRYFDDSMVMFFKPGDASDLARCILKLYQEPELCQYLSRNAAKFLETHCWEKEKEKLFSLVDSL